MCRARARARAFRQTPGKPSRLQVYTDATTAERQVRIRSRMEDVPAGHPEMKNPTTCGSEGPDDPIEIRSEALIDIVVAAIARCVEQ